MCEMVTGHITTDQAQVQPRSSPFGIHVVDRVALGQIFLGFSVSPFSYYPIDKRWTTGLLRGHSSTETWSLPTARELQ
jgi:hypothetical protein